MRTYDLYLESGPKRKKTMAHVFELLGCIANGPTSEEAVAAAPEAIRTYLRFLKRHGERVDPKAPFEVRVAEHIAETAIFIGQGSPYIAFGPDLEPVTPKDIETYVARFHAMRETLAEWVESQTDRQLDAEPKGGGRPARSVLLHVLNGTGYLSPVLGTINGMSSLYNAAEKGDVPLGEALRRVDEAIAERLPKATAEQRRAVIHRPKEVRTLRQGIRRLLEHDWEHLAELSRRPGGPRL